MRSILPPLLAVVLALPPAAATGEGPAAGAVITRGGGRRPRPKEVRRFVKALAKGLKTAGWSPLQRKEMARAAGLDKKLGIWACSQPEPEPEPGGAPGDPPAPPGDWLGEAELHCAVDLAGTLGLERLVLGRVRYESKAYLVTLRHVRVDLGRVVHRVEQRVPGKRFRKVLAFAPALARRIVAEFGGFVLACNVEGADVELNGQFFGQTPLEQPEIEVGTYRLAVTADGYFAWKGEFEVEPGLVKTVPVELQQPRMSDPPPPPMAARLLPWALVGGGGAALLGGVVLAATSKGNAQLGGAGLALLGTGTLVYAISYEF